MNTLQDASTNIITTITMYITPQCVRQMVIEQGTDLYGHPQENGLGFRLFKSMFLRYYSDKCFVAENL